MNWVLVKRSLFLKCFYYMGSFENRRIHYLLPVLQTTHWNLQNNVNLLQVNSVVSINLNTSTRWNSDNLVDSTILAGVSHQFSMPTMLRCGNHNNNKLFWYQLVSRKYKSMRLTIERMMKIVSELILISRADNFLTL